MDESERRDVLEQSRDSTLVGVMPTAKPRSTEWRNVREKHVKDHPVCLACGGTKFLEVHHVFPFHLFPELELDPSNLMTLCSSGPGNIDCHLIVGHCGNWKDYNPDPSNYSYLFRRMFERRIRS